MSNIDRLLQATNPKAASFNQFRDQLNTYRFQRELNNSRARKRAVQVAILGWFGAFCLIAAALGIAVYSVDHKLSTMMDEITSYHAAPKPVVPAPVHRLTQ